MISKNEKQFIINQIVNTPCKALSKHKACEYYGVSLRSIQRWRKRTSLSDSRKGPKYVRHKLKPHEEKKILEVLTCPEYVDMSPNCIVPSLADKGVFLASERTFYRILQKHRLKVHRGKCRPKIRKIIPIPKADKPNMIWSWDITYLKTSVKGHHFLLYLFLDVYSRKVVAARVFARESTAIASDLFKQAIQAENADPEAIRLHSDNGAAMTGSTMRTTLQSMGVLQTLSRPNVSNDNAFSESFFKTLKYAPQYPYKGFSTMDEAQAWVKKFIHWYNNSHLHSSISFVTPMARHSGQDQKILKNRRRVYELAKRRKPERFVNGIRKWSFQSEVWLVSNREMYQAA